MKKIWLKRSLYLLVAAFLCLTITSCGEDDIKCENHVDANTDYICDICGAKLEKDDEGKTPEKKDWTENELFWDADKNGKEDWTEKEITLTYATWQYNNPDNETIDTLLIKEFMEKYPNVHVEMQIVGEDAEWEQNLQALLETGDIPDVFLVKRLENMFGSGILADLTSFYDHDDDTKFIFDSVKDLGLYKGKRYVVPTFIYPHLWIVNLDLLNSANLEAPSYEWSWDQMESIAKAVSNPTTKVVGCYRTSQYYYEYSKVLKMAQNSEEAKKWLACSFDGEKFNFDDDVFLTAMDAMKNGLAEGWLVNEYGEEDLLNYYGDGSIDPRYQGYVGVWRQPSWEFKDHIADLQFEWDVYPGPGGISGGNTDIAGISTFCENKQAAYQLLKWMSYSKEGLIRRFALYEEYGEELYVSANNYPFPVVDYGINGKGENEVWDNLPYADTAPGFSSPAFIEGLRNGAIQANKETVGWDDAITAVNGYLSQIIMEGADFATLREEMQNAANTALNQKKTAIDDLLNQFGK